MDCGGKGALSLGVSICSAAVSGAGSLSATRSKSVDCICAPEARRIKASDVDGETFNATGGRHDE